MFKKSKSHNGNSEGTKYLIKFNESKITDTFEIFDDNHGFFKKNNVFTGELLQSDRKTAMQKVVDLGGVIKSGVNSKTHYCVSIEIYILNSAYLSLMNKKKHISLRNMQVEDSYSQKIQHGCVHLF
ncbi:hypothetical protein CHI06_19955 [Bacillus sp. 7884-1]|nr:hypothetical protein CHI06_19955 [Bacillus sp. 7884-1]